MAKTIGFTYDLRTDVALKDTDPPDLYAELDKSETIDFVKSAIESAGHKVVLIGNLANLLKMLPDLKVDIILNICEGRGSRNREAQVPVILETHGIPYVGSDGLTMSLALDKIMTKKVLIAEGIPTPKYIDIKILDDLINLDHMVFPMIVKLRQEGTSQGISEKSVVYNDKELKNQAEYLFDTYKNKPLFIEEFISGTEFTVPIIGNSPPEVLPPAQVIIDGKTDLGDKIYTFSRVTSSDLDYICPVKVSKNLEEKIRELTLRTYQAIDCLDFGRVDFRVDKDGNPYVLEINPLPSLAHDDVFNLSPYVAGHDYKWVINRIIDAAFKRYGLS